MSAAEREGTAYLQADADWHPPDEGWAVYGWDERAKQPKPPPGPERCEAACLSFHVIVRCLRERGHEGQHVMHP